MKWLEVIGSFTLAVILALVVTFALPGDDITGMPTMSEALLSLLSLGLLGLGVYQTVAILIKDFYATGNRHG